MVYCGRLSEGSIRHRKMISDATAAFEAGELDSSKMPFADAVDEREYMLDSGSSLSSDAFDGVALKRRCDGRPIGHRMKSVVWLICLW